MKLHLATHHGMCFGVRDALRTTHNSSQDSPVTMLGQLVHNPLVDLHLKTLGVQEGNLADPASAATHAVIITAHGAANHQKAAWEQAGHRVIDTTCPLVRKAHDALQSLVESGYFPVVIGQASHVEVLGLTGDYPQARVVMGDADIAALPPERKYGVISQTTQPLIKVLGLVDSIKRSRPSAEVRFVDTVCRPTKQRQSALEALCTRCSVIIVIGGRNSNNTRQLAETARQLGCKSYQVERDSEVDPDWFSPGMEVGVTAGTSTLDETVRAVMDRLQKIAAQHATGGLLKSLLRQSF